MLSSMDFLPYFTISDIIGSDVDRVQVKAQFCSDCHTQAMSLTLHQSFPYFLNYLLLMGLIHISIYYFYINLK